MFPAGEPAGGVGSRQESEHGCLEQPAGVADPWPAVQSTHRAPGGVEPDDRGAAGVDDPRRAVNSEPAQREGHAGHDGDGVERLDVQVQVAAAGRGGGRRASGQFGHGVGEAARINAGQGRQHVRSWAR